MNIGLYTSVFFNNIGNGFIDFGAEATLKAAVYDSDNIIKLSQCANFAASLGKSFLIKENIVIRWLWEHIVPHFERKVHDYTYRGISTLDVLSPAKIAKLDYLIIPGCVLTDAFFTIYGKFLEDKIAQSCKLIFLGASGNYYTENEVDIVSKWLNKIRPYSIVFRDNVAYGHYASYTNNPFNGIDNVFFVNRLNMPKVCTTMDPYIILNFDIAKHYNIKKELEHKFAGRNIIYTDHKPYPYIKVSRLANRNVICSDYPLDYLFLYRNVTETHSDRVHACIPTLSFGNKAQLYSDSPRIALFENVGIDINEIKSKPVALERDYLKNLQDKQIAFLKRILI